MWGGHFTSQASWQDVARDHNHGLNQTCSLGVSASGSCLPEEFWMWEQFNFFSLLSHTIVSHLGMFHSLAARTSEVALITSFLDVSERVVPHGCLL